MKAVPLEKDGWMGADTGPAGSAAMDPGSPVASTVDLTDTSKVEEVATPGQHRLVRHRLPPMSKH